MRLGVLANHARGYSDFPSFSEGLSLRPPVVGPVMTDDGEFPFLFGGTFIEAPQVFTIW